MQHKTTELPTICAHCGVQCVMQVHQYHEGQLSKPTRSWYVIAPLYWLGGKSFCSPSCTTAGIGMTASGNLKSEGASSVAA